MKIMRYILPLFILLLAQVSVAQSVGISEAEIRKFFDNYSNSPAKLLELMVDDLRFRDPTMNFEFISKAALVKTFSAPSGVTKFRAEIVSMYFISRFVVDVHGTLTGEMKGKPFRTLFSTILVFNREKKLISWTDHVDPQTFAGNSPVSEKNKRFIEDFFKFYAKLNPVGLENYLDENVRLVDPTLNLDFKGIGTIKEVWKQAAKTFSGGKFELKKIYFITENVIDAHGFKKVKTKPGKKLELPFSTIFILKKGKIRHWVDHVDKDSL